jgi:hypothetical protein
LRDGAVRFDSPASQISSEQLRSLYAHAAQAPEPHDLPPEEAGETAVAPMVWR